MTFGPSAREKEDNDSNTSTTTTITPQSGDDSTDLSIQYGTPAFEPVTSFSVLKDRIRHHYEEASDYYYRLWGEHIHHGYFLSATDTKGVAQIQLIELLLQRSALPAGSTVLDVGCGIGGTSRYLAKKHGCDVVGVTISGRQVEMARKLSQEEAVAEAEAGSEISGVVVVDDEKANNEDVDGNSDDGTAIRIGSGSVCFVELDAEKMAEYFGNGTGEQQLQRFDCIWISEAMSHLPDKALFFRNAELLLNKGGRLVVADWFKAEDLTDEQMEDDIRPIEDGMLLPPLCSQPDYVNLAQKAGLRVFSEPFDISKHVSKTWDISWSLIQSPALWAFAVSQGRDGLAFLQAFRAMRRGFANGSFRYAVMVFRKGEGEWLKN